MAPSLHDSKCWSIEKWDPAVHGTAWGRHMRNIYHQLCIALHTHILANQYHPTKNPQAREKAQVLYDKLMKIALTRAPTNGKDIFTRYIYVPSTGKRGTDVYKKVLEVRQHQKAVYKNGRVTYVEAPYTVQTRAEETQLHSVVSYVEQNYPRVLYRYLRKHQPELLTTGVTTA